MYNECLLLIDEKINMLTSGKRANDFGLPSPKYVEILSTLGADYLRETQYIPEELCKIIDEREPKLNPEQKYIVDTIMNDVEKCIGNSYYLDALGGTGKRLYFIQFFFFSIYYYIYFFKGKTWILNLLLCKVRMKDKIALGVASAGVAAAIIFNGRTAHSGLKLPLDLDAKGDSAVCNISRNSSMARLLKDTKLIVWDEITMMNKHGVESLDRSPNCGVIYYCFLILIIISNEFFCIEFCFCLS